MTVKILSESEKTLVVNQARSECYTKREIAENFGVSVDTIRRVLKERNQTGMTIAFDGELTIDAPVTTMTIVKPRKEGILAVKGEVFVKEPEYQWSASGKFISITKGRDTWNADKDHQGFSAAFTLLATSVHAVDKAEEQKLIEQARDAINIERAISAFVKDNVRIECGALYYNDIEIKSGLTDRIINAMEAGEDFEFFLPFLENLMLNPSRKAVYRLFDFLVANDIEITEDGEFIGWKVVRDDYTDCHSGTFDNSPGKEVTMPRNMVDEDDERTCSAGLHVCARSYIKHFHYGTDRLVRVKVHPRDVVSIPVDYGDSKLRACRYVVLDDVSARVEELKEAFNV